MTQVGRTLTLSRTDKRRTVNDYSVVETSPSRKASSDKDLLVEPQNLCAQPLEAIYRRKLEAIALLLQRREPNQIEHRAKASLRTVQRWANRARRFGASALHGSSRNGRLAKLSEALGPREETSLQAELPVVRI